MLMNGRRDARSVTPLACENQKEEKRKRKKEKKYKAAIMQPAPHV